MNKNEISELRAQIKPDSKKLRISRLMLAYFVIQENAPVLKSFQIHAFDELPEAEQKLHAQILKKVLSGKPGRNLQEYEFVKDENGSSNFQKQLYALNNSKLENAAYVQTFAEQFAQAAGYYNNFMLSIASAEYLSAQKDKNQEEIPDGEVSRFQFMIAAVNPVELTDIGLYYNEVSNGIEKKTDTDRHVLPGTIDGFVYPCFTEGGADVNHVLYYTKTPKKPNELLIENVLGAQAYAPFQEEKDTFVKLLESTAQEELDLSLISHVFGTIRDLIQDEEGDGSEMEPISMNEMKTLLAQSGMSEEKLAGFESNYAAIVQDSQLKPINMMETDKLSVKMADVSVNVKPDAAYKVQTRMIDGRQYLCIAIDDGLEVNGIEVAR